MAAAAVVLALAWTLAGGKDMNWDQTNYHFYVAHALFEDRVAHDFMPAGGASYFNPLAYVPFYWMVIQDWHSVLVGSVLASVHAANVILAYSIARKACITNGRERWHWPVCVLAALLAFLSPIFLAELGTTFADVSTSVLVLSGVLLLLDAEQGAPLLRNRALLAGLLIGAAGGLKLSNAVYGPALVVMACFLPFSLRARARAAAWVVAGGVCGFVMVHGYWSWRLWTEFANPFFPLFNSIFQSIDYPAISHRHERFLPDSWLQALLLPLQMASPRAWIYTDTVSPDLRYAAAVVALVAAGIVASLHSLRGHQSIRPVVEQKRLPALAAFFVVGFALWVGTSGNGRYGVALSILCGPLLAVAICASVRARLACAALAGLALLQLLHYVHNGDQRWHVAPWSRSWYEASVPAQLAREPYLYLAIGNSSHSYIVPYLDQRSAFVSLLGLTTIDLDGPGGRRVRELMRRYDGRIRVLARAPSLEFTAVPMTEVPRKWRSAIDSHLSRVDLRVDETDCHVVTTALAREHGGTLEWKEAWRANLLSCLLVRREGDHRAEHNERERVKKIFSAIAQWCPKFFKPAAAVVEKSPQGWFSVYPDTDSFLLVEGDHVRVAQMRTSLDLHLGTLIDWERGRARHDCASLPTKLRTRLNFD